MNKLYLFALTCLALAASASGRPSQSQDLDASKQWRSTGAQFDEGTKPVSDSSEEDSKEVDMQSRTKRNVKIWVINQPTVRELPENQNLDTTEEQSSGAGIAYRKRRYSQNTESNTNKAQAGQYKRESELSKVIEMAELDSKENYKEKRNAPNETPNQSKSGSGDWEYKDRIVREVVGEDSIEDQHEKFEERQQEPNRNRDLNEKLAQQNRMVREIIQNKSGVDAKQNVDDGTRGTQRQRRDVQQQDFMEADRASTLDVNHV